MKTLELLLVSMRPYRWWRAGVIFVPYILAGSPFNLIYLLKIITGALLFALLSGSISVIDDITKKEADKDDPLKRARPIASGELGIESAEFSVGIVLLGCFVAAFFLGSLFGIVAVVYLFVALSYFLFLKKIAFIDALTIGCLTCLLIIAGTVAIGEPVSPWLISAVFSYSVLAALCERRRDMLILSASGQQQGFYEERSVDQAIAAASAFSLTVYTMFALISPAASASNLVYTVPFVLYGTFRLLHLTYDRSAVTRLEKLALKDYMFWGNIAAWAVAAVALTLIF